VSSPRSIRLTDRDWGLLAYLEEQGFATQDQLSKEFFNSKVTCRLRLGKLGEHGYIERTTLPEALRIQRLNSKSAIFPHILNLNVSRNTPLYYINRSYSKGFGKSRKLFKPNLVIHQLILNEVRSFLDKTLSPKWLLNDPRLALLSDIQYGRNREIIPDLSYEWDEHKVAIELERTCKSAHRYSLKLHEFRDSIYSHVIYYYTRETILKSLIRRSERNRQVAFAHYKAPNELYSPAFGVLTLNEFIEKRRDR